MASQVYECPECKERKLVEFSNSHNLGPTLWCNCEGFVKMDKIDK